MTTTFLCLRLAALTAISLPRALSVSVTDRVRVTGHRCAPVPAQVRVTMTVVHLTVTCLTWALPKAVPPPPPPEPPPPEPAACTTAVGEDVAGLLEPPGLLAISCTRRV